MRGSLESTTFNGVKEKKIGRCRKKHPSFIKQAKKRKKKKKEKKKKKRRKAGLLPLPLTPSFAPQKIQSDNKDINYVW